MQENRKRPQPKTITGMVSAGTEMKEKEALDAGDEAIAGETDD
uniref:Uncharacterized protein n=1 Tax=Utricularia reniformis TaxID=192314 RepID=A0A1Y0B3Q1_9LAMI|nr:hypothetical protein AEK19_MT1918 [Utricularia reniformis]ART32085.1 hypothetical protein AEK19_MT1918 [Utricularia reniformis]